MRAVASNTIEPRQAEASWRGFFRAPMDEEIEVEIASTCTLITVQKEHLAALLELESLVRSPFTSIGEYYVALKRLEPWRK